MSEMVCRAYVDELLRLEADSTAWRLKFNALNADRNVGKAQMAAIANDYLNRPSGGNHLYRFRTRTAALSRIKDAFIDRFERSSKETIIKRLTAW